MKNTFKHMIEEKRVKQETKKKKKRLAVRKLNGQPPKDMGEYGEPEKVSLKTQKKTKEKSGLHLSEKQKINKYTLVSRKKANKASKKKVNEKKARMRKISKGKT